LYFRWKTCANDITIVKQAVSRQSHERFVAQASTLDLVSIILQLPIEGDWMADDPNGSKV
jgi:hypothetical protein